MAVSSTPALATVNGYLTIGLSIAMAAAIAPAPVVAQVPDATLGNEGSVVTPNSLVQGEWVDLIEGGAARGSNLFHSFQTFDIDVDQRVYFANPAGIEAILSRVTGGSPSSIFGTLGVDGPADLFFLNPNGIVFGETATLDVSGSFYATTAAAIPLGEGTFSATMPEQSTLLSVNPSVLLENYLTPSTGNIENQGQLVAGADLTLAANRLELQGQLAAGADLTLWAADEVQIRDTAEVPFIALAGGDLRVQGNDSVDIFALSHPASGLFAYGDLVLRSANPVGGDAQYQAGGSFRVEQLDGQLGGLESPYDPVIRSLGDVSFDSYLGASLHILAGGSVIVPGVILITRSEPTTGLVGTNFLQETVTLSDGITLVEIDGSARPTLDIRAGVDPAAIGVPGSPPLNSGATEFFEPDTFFVSPLLPVLGDTAPDLRADIEVGSIAFVDVADFLDLLTVVATDPTGLVERLIPGDVLLTNHYQPNLDLEGEITVSSSLADFLDRLGIGNLATLPDFAIQSGGLEGGGRLFVDSRSAVNLDGIVSTSAAIPNAGSTVFEAVGGEITLQAKGDINLLPGTAVVSAGAPNGPIRFVSDGSLTVNDGAIVSLTAGGGAGDDLFIDTEQVRLTNETGAGTQTLLDLISFFGVDPQLQNLVEGLEGSSGILATAFFGGQSGDLIVNTGDLQIVNNAPFGSNGNAGIATFGPGEVGNLTITAETIDIVGNNPDIFAPDAGRGLAFDIRNIPTGLSTAALGEGAAGTLTLNTRSLSVRNGAGITTSSIRTSGPAGDAGELRIIGAETIDLQGLAALATGTLGAGNSGDLIIEDAGVITLQDGAIIATDTIGSGNAGNLEIAGDRLIVMDGSRIGAATGDRGLGGNIQLTFAEQIDLVGSSTTESGTLVPSGVFTTAQGIASAGNITLSTPALTLREGAEISAATLGPGTGGSIEVMANALTLDASTITASSVGRGDAGDITLQIQGPIALVDSTIAALVDPNDELLRFESGNFAGWAAVGDIRIVDAAYGLEPIEGNQQALVTTTFPGNTGVPVSADNLEAFLTLPSGSLSGSEPALDPILEGAAIKTVFTAEAGEEVSFEWNFVTAELTPDETFNDYAFVSLTSVSELADTGFPDGSGSGFTPVNVDLQNDGNLLPADATGSQSFVATLPATGTYELGIGVGDVGDINNTFTSQILIDRVELPRGRGEGGDLTIQADSITLERSQLAARSSSLGNAGNISLAVEDTLTALNSDISTEADQASGGLIEVTAGDIFLEQDSDIRTNVLTGQGEGGDIFLRADQILAFADSDILAFSADGIGGDITLQTPAFFGQNFRPTPQLTTQEELEALDGNDRVDVNATGRIVSGDISLPDVSFIENSLNELPATPLNTETLTAGSCIVAREDTMGSFIVTGSEGLPQQPASDLISVYPTGIIRTTADVVLRPAIQEAQAVYRLADGRLVLSHSCSWVSSSVDNHRDRDGASSNE